MGRFALKVMMRPLFHSLLLFVRGLGFTILMIMYVVRRLADPLVKAAVCARRWLAPRSADTDELQERETAGERESTDELLLGEPVNALQADTTNDPVTTPELANEQSAAGSASVKRVETMSKESSRTAAKVRAKNAENYNTELRS